MLTIPSTVIRCWTSWTSTTLSTIVFSAKVATTIRATTSKTFPRLDATSRTPSLSTTRQRRISSTPSTPYQSAAGFQMRMITNCWISFPFWKTLPVPTCKTLAWSWTSLFRSVQRWTLSVLIIQHLVDEQLIAGCFGSYLSQAKRRKCVILSNHLNMAWRVSQT